MSEENKIEEGPQDGKTESPEENIAPADVEQQQTINYKPQTEEMEVHHHAHAHGKKNWKTYLWEFLMLFLAVFCGFLAENFREHRVENEREMVYMQSVFNDLQKDTALINNCIYQSGFIIRGHDSLEYMLENFRNEPAFIKRLYVLNAAFTYINAAMVWNSSTFEELKGSGNLRLIRKQEVKNKMALYEITKKYCDGQFQYSYNTINKTYDAGAAIFDITYYKTLHNLVQQDSKNEIPKLSYDSLSHFISGRPLLLTTDAVILKKYLRMVNNEKNQMMLYISSIEAARERAAELIESIKKNYHFN